MGTGGIIISPVTGRVPNSSMNRLDLIYPALICRLDHAMVAVNGIKFTGHPIPFGGMKASGLGRTYQPRARPDGWC